MHMCRMGRRFDRTCAGPRCWMSSNSLGDPRCCGSFPAALPPDSRPNKERPRQQLCTGPKCSCGWGDSAFFWPWARIAVRELTSSCLWDHPLLAAISTDSQARASWSRHFWLGHQKAMFLIGDTQFHCFRPMAKLGKAAVRGAIFR
jgi:hypothetical protein